MEKVRLVAPVSKAALLNRIRVGPVSKTPVLMRFGNTGFKTNGGAVGTKVLKVRGLLYPKERGEMSG